jgi:sulfur carrier protein ThiS
LQISVQLHTTLQKQTPEGLIDRVEVDLPLGSTLQDLITELEINYSLDSLLLVVNGRVAEPSLALTAGDRVNLMPAISGGQI